MARESEAIAINDVDVARSRREAVLERARAFVGKRRHDARDDFFVRDRPARDATLLPLFFGQLIDERIRRPVAAARRVVLIPPRAGLLAVASHREEPIRNRRLRSLRARLAD